MHDFQLYFSHPWLLLLLIPALALTLIPYFMLAKKYRRTRNRICSMVLHMCVMVLAITVLAGIRFDYKLTNDQNEILFVVDVSDSQEYSDIKRDQFVKTALEKVQYDGFRVGIVTFGFDNRYVVPMTNNVGRIYDDYMKSYEDADMLPDTTGSDIAAALRYARTLFQYPATAKIVLVTDGKQTDENALNVIGQITAQGTRIDAVHIPSEFEENDIQILDVKFPDYHVSVGDECSINVTLQTSSNITASIKITDNGVEGTPHEIDLSTGTHTIVVKHTFEEEGLHDVGFSIEQFSSNYNDGILENNIYNAYFQIEVYDKILILERATGESDALVKLLSEQGEYDVTVLNVYESEDIPSTVDELRQFDQVILNNISNYDLGSGVLTGGTRNTNMPEGFDIMLEDYVKNYGGGLLTVGGKDGEEANAYNRQDLYGSLYQQMLPVQAINYTPPLGVIVIVDISGSMQSENAAGVSYLDLAKMAAVNTLSVLSERDYLGVMTLSDDYEMVLPLTPRTQESKIRSAINSIDFGGATIYPGAIERAGQMLRALTSVDRRHIVMISDGQVGDDQREQYEQLIKDYYEMDEISFSFLGIGMAKDSDLDETASIDDPALNGESLSPYKKMLRAVILGHGRICTSDDTTTVSTWMKENLSVPALKEVENEPFFPTINNILSPLVTGIETGTTDADRNKMTVQLGGFFGVKLRTNAEMVLTGDFGVPLYVQWKYEKERGGKGMVGSFMCDLTGGEWSGEFMNNPNGQLFLLNVVENLMPIENIRPTAFTAKLKEDNYINQLNIYATLEENESIRGTIENTASGEKISLNEVAGDSTTDMVYVTMALASSNGFSRSDFVVKERGVYKITLQKYDASGNPIDGTLYELYKDFSYSTEYNLLPEETEIDAGSVLLADIAERGDGAVIADLESPDEILDGFITDIPKSYDPRIAFIIAAIVLFLLDIAVRKFKFKWIHEIIRERKEKKSK